MKARFCLGIQPAFIVPSQRMLARQEG